MHAPSCMLAHILQCTMHIFDRPMCVFSEVKPGVAVRLDGLRITVVGGDAREALLIDGLLQSGAHITAIGYKKEQLPENVTASNDLVMAVRQADAVIAPMSNTDAEGNVKAVPDESSIRLDETFFKNMRRGIPFFIGMAQPVIRQLAQQHNVRLIETAEIEQVAILNSIPTAEGAIRCAMEQMQITLHQARATVLGFGRCGMTLARTLLSLGAYTTVFARSRGQLARAEEMGLQAVHWDLFSQRVSASDVIFNTVPAPVLHRDILQTLDSSCVIIDIASAPGGTDFKAAQQLGITARLELGLPGRFTPVSAGRILVDCLPPIIKEQCT